MLVEPINISGKSPAPPAQEKPPVEAEAPREDVKVEKEPDPSGDPSGLTELLSDVQKNLNMIHDLDLQFTVHEASGKMMVKVMDGSTGRVIREIPPSEILDLAARLDEMIGLIFDQKG